MTTAVALQRTDVPASVPEMMEVAKFLKHSAMLPKHLVGDQASVFAVMLKARALDIPMTTAFDHIVVQDGKTGMSGVLMQALVNRASFALFPVWELCTPESGTVRAERPGIGEDKCGWVDVTFTLDDAERAHLIQRTTDGKVRARAKDNENFAKPWERYTRDMLIWRAIGRAARFFFNDVLLGMVYTPDELGGTIGPDGNVVKVESIRVDVDDVVRAFVLRIADTQEIEPTLRALYEEIRDADMLEALGPNGATLEETVRDRKTALAKLTAEATENAARAERRAEWERARAEAMNGGAAAPDTEPAPPADQPETDDAPADTHTAADTEGDGSTGVVSHEPAANPENDFDALDTAPAPAADTADTPRRRGVLRVIGETFGDREAGSAAAVQHFGRPIDTVGTPELQDWLATARKANAS